MISPRIDSNVCFATEIEKQNPNNDMRSTKSCIFPFYFISAMKTINMGKNTAHVGNVCTLFYFALLIISIREKKLYCITRATVATFVQINFVSQSHSRCGKMSYESIP